MPSIAAPPFDGKGEPFPSHAMEVELRFKQTNLEVDNRASALVTGSGKLMEPDGVVRALQVLHDYFVPDALGAVYQDVVRVSQFRRANRTMGKYLERPNLLRRQPESRMQPGGTFPEASASALSLRGAPLSRAAKLLVLAACVGNWGSWTSHCEGAGCLGQWVEVDGKASYCRRTIEKKNPTRRKMISNRGWLAVRLTNRGSKGKRGKRGAGGGNKARR